MRPTEEQLDALAMFRTGDHEVVEAGAGTGKTSTLRLLAQSSLRRGGYFAFNTAIVADVRSSISRRCEARTIHSVAMGAVGGPFRHRLGSERMPGWRIAKELGIDNITLRYDGKLKTLQHGYLGSFVMRAVNGFCNTADEEPGLQHFPYIDGIDTPQADGKRSWENNDRVRAELLPALQKAWEDVRRPDGQLTFQHAHYLKVWQLSGPRIPCDYVLVDEGQDLNPVMASIMQAQMEHAQLVVVGDSAQQIYGWMGSVNALANLPIDNRCWLTQSFRFGPAIAAEANTILELLDRPPESPCQLRLRGLDSIPSVVGPVPPAELPDCVLTRTNAACMTVLLEFVEQQVPVHVAGGGKEVVAFARAAQELQTQNGTYYPDLACFTSWKQVQEYVEHDPQGDELRLMVNLIDKFGADVILRSLENMPSESDAQVVVSTAHKAKGREWARVRIDGDFAGRMPTFEELRLRYVAYTRARELLDLSALEAEDAVLAPLPDLDRR